MHGQDYVGLSGDMIDEVSIAAKILVDQSQDSQVLASHIDLELRRRIAPHRGWHSCGFWTEAAKAYPSPS